MTILHIELLGPSQKVKITNHITSQGFKLIKSTVTSRHCTTGTDGLLGNLEIQMAGLQGNEILSNTTQGRIPLPIIKHYQNNQLLTADVDMNLEFTAESIPTEFVVHTMGYFSGQGNTSIENLREGKIQELPKDANGFYEDVAGFGSPLMINLYFEYQSNGRYF